VARGGKVLCPPEDLLVQIVDARDIATWNLDLIDKGTTGVFNATGHPEPMRAVFDACVKASGSDAEPVWSTDEFLLENEVGPWMEMPLWLPASMGSGLMETDVSKAFAAGLKCRPTVDIARDTIEWAKDAPMGGMPPGAGLAAEKEAALLEKASLD
jgi:2'-hydroxyisoflavone reductase